jgi:hypothetical protein
MVVLLPQSHRRFSSTLEFNGLAQSGQEHALAHKLQRSAIGSWKTLTGLAGSALRWSFIHACLNHTAGDLNRPSERVTISPPKLFIVFPVTVTSR